MPPMRNVLAGINTCGIPSTEDTRSFANSAVGKASFVGVKVGTMFSTVDVEITRGGIVGSGVDVVSSIGTFVGAQAVRMERMIAMTFFI